MILSHNPKTLGRYLTDEAYVLEVGSQVRGDADLAKDSEAADILFARKLALKTLALVGHAQAAEIDAGTHDVALLELRLMLQNHRQ